MTVRTRPLIVDREAELATLEATLAGAAAGTPAIVILSGEAGIGKTRLVEELTDRARRAGARVLIGSCLDLGEGRIPFAPLTQALRMLAHEVAPSALDRLLGPARDELTRLVPDLASATRPPTAQAEATGQAARARLFESVLGALERLGRDSPLVLVIEDVHWIDDASRDLLTFLARNVSVERVLVVITHRSNALPRSTAMDSYLAELQRSRSVQRISVPPLGSTDTRALIAELAGELPGNDVSLRIHERAEGNPLFVEELLAAQQAGETSLPDSLRGMLLGPVERLSSPARRVINLAAVAGRPLDERVIAPATGLAEEPLLKAFREAVAARILVATEAGYAFRHVLLRDAVLDDLLPTETRRLHERLAETLAGLSDVDATSAAELAGHWAAADRRAEALRASVDAAEAAERVYAFGDALRHYETALGLWHRTPADDRPFEGLVELLRRAAEAANMAGEVIPAMRFVEQALAVAVPSATVVRGLLHGRLGYLQWLRGENEAAIASHREAVGLVPDEPATAERARVLGGLAGALMGAGQYRESGAVAEQAIASARKAASVTEEARGLNILGSDLVSLGEAEAGLGYLERALELSADGAIDARIVVFHNLAFALEQTDRLDHGLQFAKEAIELVHESGLERRFGSVLRAVAGECLFRLGRWDEADTITREGLALKAPPEQALYLLGVRAELLLARGEVDEARRLLELAEEAISAHVDPDLQAFIATRQAERALHERRWNVAADAVERGLDALGVAEIVTLSAQLHALGIRIQAARFSEASIRRDPIEAADARMRAERLRLAAPTAPAGDGKGTGRSAHAWIATAKAEMAVFEGTTDPRTWAAVAEAWDCVPMPFMAAYARLRQANAMLGAGGDRATAVEPIRLAGETARSLRAAPLLSAIEGLAQRARIDLPSAPDEDADGAAGPARGRPPGEEDPAARLGLSAREVEVLRLLAQGRTNGQIAAELFISPKTASVHVTHILVKLGVNNRVEAAMIAARSGLADRVEDHPGG